MERLYFVFLHSSANGLRAVFTFWLLQVRLLWTCVYTSLFKHLLSVLLGAHSGVELLGHTLTLGFIFWGTAKLFSLVAAQCYILTPLIYICLLTSPKHNCSRYELWPLTPDPFSLPRWGMKHDVLDGPWSCRIQAEWCWGGRSAVLSFNFNL